MDEERILLKEKYGVEKVVFYTQHCPTGPFMTVCLFLNKDKELIARGVAICSLLETFSNKDGRNKSFGRAKKATISGASSLPINWTPERYEFEYIPRKYRAKTEALAEEFRENIQNVGFDYKEQQDSRGHSVFRYDVPRSFPLEIASSFYEFKSHYLPTLIDFEVDMLFEGELL